MLNRQEARQTPSGGKQIAIYSSTSNQVMYTVPQGKVFVGFASAKNGNGGIIINGAQVPMDVQSSGSSSVPFPLTLIGGTVVRNQTSTGACLIGVEQ